MIVCCLPYEVCTRGKLRFLNNFHFPLSIYLVWVLFVCVIKYKYYYCLVFLTKHNVNSTMCTLRKQRFNISSTQARLLFTNKPLKCMLISYWPAATYRMYTNSTLMYQIVYNFYGGYWIDSIRYCYAWFAFEEIRKPRWPCRIINWFRIFIPCCRTHARTKKLSEIWNEKWFALRNEWMDELNW